MSIFNLQKMAKSLYNSYKINIFLALFLGILLFSLAPLPLQLYPCKVFADEEPYFIGNRKCRLCHFEYFKERENDLHANAFECLGRMKNNPYCLKCHTTGYREPQGFVSENITPQLRGVQCEACHGPGSKHKDNPEDEHALPIGRKIDYQTVCIKCHDRNWTPEFNYKKYLDKIKHTIEPKKEKGTSP
ncbi:MAG: cytochrome c family protein [Proteobacteria bacterium]|nr:cytochrome c family protein [Pseudomonadota bacterium]MBU4012198.1 cytochrome c family protein [Pseudomonadota bacterium]MBU4067350.1 cytochrome c family protein [Pseudomonadota bacterium]MBU4102035.1 cytochrome c family protein [Pseudomonadota bacterium]MBU4128156.1 cytochrome c family protein [Pseudomonadota bacterium]